jgi:hypothetical protein
MQLRVEEGSSGDEKRADALFYERCERCIQFSVVVRPPHKQLLIDRFGRRFELQQFLLRRWEARIHEYADKWNPRHELAQQAEPLRLHFIGPKRVASNVAAGSTQARNQAGLDGVASHPEDDWDCLRCLDRNGGRNIAADADQDGHFVIDQIGSERRQLVVVTVRPTVLDLDGLAFDKTCFSQALSERRGNVGRILW